MLGLAFVSGIALAGVVFKGRGVGGSGYFEAKYKALEILKERLEHGEISMAEFEERRNAIAC